MKQERCQVASPGPHIKEFTSYIRLNTTARIVLNRSNTRIMRSNPARGPRFFVLPFPVQAERDLAMGPSYYVSKDS
jgi:hypothetical protein